MELLPDVYFSESEFEQAGLLHDTHGCVSASSPISTAKTSGDHSHECDGTRQPEPASLLGQARPLQNPSESWQEPLLGPGLVPGASHTEATHRTSGLGEEIALQGNPLFGQDPDVDVMRWTDLDQQQATEAQQQQTADVPQQQAIRTNLDLTGDAISKKQTNREHQKRFRLRQKVLSHFKHPCCSLLSTLQLVNGLLTWSHNGTGLSVKHLLVG